MSKWMTSWWMIIAVMIAATSHWLLLPICDIPITWLMVMWSAKLENTAHRKKKKQKQKKTMRYIFMNERNIWAFRQIWAMSFRYAHLHHMSNQVIPFGKYCHQLFTISFHDFSFLLELSKMYWVGDLERAEQRSVR